MTAARESGSPRGLFSPYLGLVLTLEAIADKLMISEVMSFACSDSCENGITKEKVLAKGSGKSHFQSISGSKEMDWNFQSVKYLDELVEQYSGRKNGGQEAEFQARIRKE